MRAEVVLVEQVVTVPHSLAGLDSVSVATGDDPISETALGIGASVASAEAGSRILGVDHGNHGRAECHVGHEMAIHDIDM